MSSSNPPDGGKPLPSAPLKPLAAAAVPPPVIPTSMLAPDEQRRLCIWVIGLIEVMKVWDAVAPNITDLPPALSSTLRVGGPISAALWCAAEIAGLAALSLLRVPGLSPSKKKLPVVVPLLLAWNVFCWFLADPSAFIPRVSMFGPVHLGEEGFFWGWLYLIRHIVGRLVFGPPENISGIYKIRLLPYSTATLNPLSLTYCLPPGSREPIFVPVVFNNSAPDQVAWHVRSLESHSSEVQTVPASLMKRPTGWQALKLHEEEGDDESDYDGALTQIVSSSKKLDLSRLHSVRPSESLSIIPPDLSPSESMLFITVTKPAVISLHSVTDKRGDRFNIAPHREAVIIECPTGGDFVEDSGKMILAPGKKAPAPEKRCIGSEEVVKFSARGVAPLKVSWKRMRNGLQVASGVVEGIDDDAIEDIEHFRRERTAKTHTVPLRVQHEREGDVQIALTSVVDALGNTYIPSGPSATIGFKVLARSSAAFVCRKPIKMLIGGKQELPLVVTGADDTSEVSYTFTSSTGKESLQKIKAPNGETKIEVTQPGYFSLQDVSGLCPGSVLDPVSCSVEIISPPRAEISVTTLHECALDVGVTVNFEFSGEFPFEVKWTEQRKGGSVVDRRQRFSELSAKLELRPVKEGEYIYKFATLSDKNYKDLPLEREIKQVVHPAASVDIVGSTQALYACSDDDVEIGLNITGKDPLKLMYRRSWAQHSEDITVPVKSGKHMLTVPVPDELKAGTGASGKLAITLVHVEDANGCVKRLPARNVEVAIDRQRPTARFAHAQDVVLKDGDSTEVPIRLTGRGPWELVYSLDGVKQKAITVRNPTTPLKFNAKGSYQLISIKDANCPGTADESQYKIEFRPRPSAELVDTATLTRKGNVYTHAGMCAGEEDAVGVQFTGSSPFEISYKYDHAHMSREHVLKSAQSVGILHLTSDPGLHRYFFTKVRDSNYDRTPVDFRLEVPVHGRPSARISRPNTISLCRDSSLDTDAKVKLSGTAPYTLNLGLRRPASPDVVPHMINVDSDEWTISLPHEVVSEVGRYEISILSVSDASGCDYVFEDDSILSTTVEVVETARVVPVTHETDYCVGDTLDFLLQGKSPWIVEYEWAKRVYTVTSSAARFSRAAEAEGLFAIRSVALKDRAGNAQCQRPVHIERKVHALPTVRIDDGTDNLREGDQPVVFGVHFTGTPPFTFSYTRSETVNGRSRIMETQTITDIWSERYAISSSAPGDYAVTSVADKYCRFPPLGKRADV